MIRVLKCFVTPTSTYTAQVDESVLHICTETLKIIEYMFWTCIVRTVNDSRFNMLCYATLIYTAQVDESVLHVCFDTHQIFSRCWTSFVNTVSDSRIKMVFYANLNIYRSSRRKCVTYLYWNSQNYRVYVLNWHCKDW